MGLASALSTALTGMTAAETQIDVVGNNLANAQTVAFKESEVVFATQFMQTLGLGSAPTDQSAGTNPRQIGLGTQVAEISPNFSQGTIEMSSNSSDLAIQGEGFFLVQGSASEVLYTRNGVFTTNADNELVTVTGNRLLGYGVDESFLVQTTEVVPLTIPLGQAAVAQSTQNVFLEGTLTPTGDIADQAEVIETVVLGNAHVPRADSSVVGVTTSAIPDSDDFNPAQLEGAGGTLPDGAVYQYRIAYLDDSGTESLASDAVTVTVTDTDATPNNSTVQLDLPEDSDYAGFRIYRTEDGGSAFYQLADSMGMGPGLTFEDTSPVLDTSIGNQMPTQTALDANYTYLITYHRSGEVESRPSFEIGPQNVVNGRIQLTNLPTPPVSGDGSFPDYDTIRIYRNLATDANNFYLVGEANPGESFTDNKTDTEISDLTIPGNKTVDLDGPKIESNSLLVNVVRRDELNYENMFSEGTLSFTGRKGGRTLETMDFEVTATSTVQQLIDFMEQAMGIQNTTDDPGIPQSINGIAGEGGSPLGPGGTIQDGKIRFVGNNGVDSAISIGLGGFLLDDGSGVVANPNLSFGSVQDAVGQSATTDFIVFDSLGVPINVRLTAVMESRSGTSTTYRWFAESPDNDPLSGVDVSVGTGLVSFDGEGNLIGATTTEASIDRRNSPASSPLEFDFDFTQISGLAVENSEIAASRQDGSGAGTLTSYVVGEDGIIRGQFSNGISRDLGQIRLARFSNPSGLEQLGQNLYGPGVNAGLPVEGNPGEQGIGTIISGAVELSNTDIGRNLIDLVLASTQYRGNSRVISTAQQLLDELLNLRR